MVQNTLKRRARAFAATHSVPYLTALHAVDEPLHGFRDLFGRPQNYERGFQVIPREGSFGRAYSAREEMELPRELGRIELRDYTVESGRRLSLIEELKAGDIWGYRELHRAGLLPKGSPAMEPIFHHYSAALAPELSSMFRLGRELGIYPVSLSGATEISDPPRFHLRPVTRAQLSALKSGDDAGPIEKRFTNEIPAEGDWDTSEEFGTLATLKSLGSRLNTRLALLIKGDGEAMIRELESRDLRPESFQIRNVSSDEVTLHRAGTVVVATEVRINGRREVMGTSDRLLILR